MTETKRVSYPGRRSHDVTLPGVSYEFYAPSEDTLRARRLLRFWVMDADPASVMVTGIRCGGSGNQLAAPTTLAAINDTLAAVDWWTTRSSSTMYFTAELPVYAEFECDVVAPPWVDNVRQAIWFWRRSNPNDSILEFQGMVRDVWFNTPNRE